MINNITINGHMDKDRQKLNIHQANVRYSSTIRRGITLL